MQHIESDLLNIIEDQNHYNGVPPGVDGGNKNKSGSMPTKSNAEEEKHNLRATGPEDESPSIFSRGGLYFDENP